MTERERRERRSADEVVREIQKDIHAIREQYGATQEENEVPKRVAITSSPDPNPAVSAYYDTENRERPEKWLHERLRLGLEFGAFLAAVIAAIYTGCTLHQVTRQADAAVGQVSVMHKQLEVSERPWIAADIAVYAPLTFRPGGGSIGIVFQTKNVGHSPAMRVQARGKIVLLPNKTWMAVELQNAGRDECAELLRQAEFPGTTDFFPAIFPQSTPTPIQWEATISANDIQSGLKARETGPRAHKGYISPVLVTCIDYQFSFDSTHHQTGYNFMLGIPLPEGVMMGDIRPEGQIPRVRAILVNQSAN